MLNTSFSPWPSFSIEEAEAVKNVMLSNKVNYWTGQECREFEKEFAAFAGCSHAVAVTNGTVALELALYALDIGTGDEVITTSRTFIASASSVVMRGAIPVVADVDENSQNITAETIRPLITEKTKAIIVVHLAGWPCDMDPILELAKEFDLKIIEDCAQAHGAVYKGQPVGSIGNMAAFSFCQDKIMTTGGEGGMLTTQSENLWKKAWAFKDHGKSYDAVYNRNHKPGFRWLHESFGTNWRMMEMQAVIGRLQLKKISEWHETRKKYAQQIWYKARELKGLRVPEIPIAFEHACYKCYVFVEPGQLKNGWNRDRVMKEIIKHEVPCFSGSCAEIYLEKAFDGIRSKKRHPVAQKLGETSLMFLVHPTLKPEEIQKTCTVLRKVMSLATE